MRMTLEGGGRKGWAHGELDAGGVGAVDGAKRLGKGKV